MTPEEFTSLAKQGYNRIPVVREVLADLDTPLSVYLKLADGPYSYLFESVHGGEKWGRYSIIGLPGRLRLEVRGEQIALFDGDTITETFTSDDPLTVVEEFQQRFHAAEIDGLPRFSGGLVGYFSYDTIRYIESRLKQSPNTDPLQTPEVIKPEWFFYVAFRWLKLFGGTVAVLSMGFILFVMFAWPFIDGWIRKNTKYQEASVWIGIAGAFAVIALTVWEAVARH